MIFHNHIILKKLKKAFENNKKKVEGIVKGTKKGFGFLESDSQKKYFIPPIYMKKVMHGDRIIAVIEENNERCIAKPIKLIKPFLNTFVGQIIIENKKMYIIPEHHILRKTIIYTNDTIKNSPLNHQDWVMAQLVHHKLNGNVNFYADIKEFISHDKNMLKPWLIILSKYNISKLPPMVEIKKYTKIEKSERVDLTHLHFITIDNSSTKDIDDAIFIKKNDLNQFILYIAISDPTAYIPYSSKLDSFASQRGFTNYFPNFNIPMLPRELSEDIYSLKESEKRAVLVCKILIEKNGSIVKNSINFFLAWIISKSQLSYEYVDKWIKQKEQTWKPKNTQIEKQIRTLFHLCNIRMTWRKNNCILFKDKIDYQFHFDENNNITHISIEKRNIAHHMIEEAMILANYAAAIFLKKNINKGIFNIHSGFDLKNIKKINNFLLKNGWNNKLKNKLVLKEFCEIIRFIYNLSDNYVLSRLRKLQSFGGLSYHAYPHFALGLNMYATWTSPIRKYTDMINHRLIKLVLLNQNNDFLILNRKLLTRITEIKKRNRIAEKEIQEWLYFIYLNKNNYLNKKLKGEIVDVKNNGIKVQLIKIGAIVFVPSCFLYNVKNNFFCNKEEGIIYINGQPIYRITDLVKVKIIEMNNATRNIIAELCY
ncbi:exoribonuclease II [Buchnera aphidicola (Thelaxes californica)]|uniref:Exoribonuclease II n=1 Tax=Buchnera aphidicola (Thelaxes californica) TaxID=1315998 RepID=A0A4D6YL90_9GAMM|nr:exoribonuclease II [Buchnera aphidicola]QCI26740.1 exoribonuclease II [Buchnera aphidicola (Thelaxes californica)]